MTESSDGVGASPRVAAQHEHVSNSTGIANSSHPTDGSIPEVFESQVRRFPQALALICGNTRYTYAELNRRANQVAHALLRVGVNIEDRVGVYAERDAELIVAMLGVLKAGAAYVPIDPNYPCDRVAFMLQDSSPIAVLAQGDLAKNLSSIEPIVVNISDTLAQPVENPAIQERSSRNLAYVIYTSGSTGRPKGVMIEHRSVVGLVVDTNYAQIQRTDCVAHCASPSFDAATWEVWGALLNGARLLVIPQEILLDASAFNQALVQGEASVLWLTVGLFNAYVDALEEAFSGLRYLLTGGDTLNPPVVARALSKARPPLHMLNAYGPTETTTFATTYPITVIPEDTRSVPIGRPISKTSIYIEDKTWGAGSIGEGGEICIGGSGVARGYLNQPSLTAERFVPDIFDSTYGQRMYRTGDLGHWRPDANIEHIGRNDDQVKVRGFRVEIGEIEAIVSIHPAVNQVAVVAIGEGGSKRLIGFVVANDLYQLPTAPGEDLSTHLRHYLNQKLPTYMVPDAFAILGELPRTPNGKVDRKSLGSLKLQISKSHLYEAPDGAVEQILAGIWQDILNVKEVGRQDNFFELGGNSLHIPQVLQRLRAHNLSTGARNIFESRTLETLASCLSETMDTQTVSEMSCIPFDGAKIESQMLSLIELTSDQIARVTATVDGGAQNIQDIYPLAPLQQGLLFHHILNEGGGDPYVVPMLFLLSSDQKSENFLQALQLIVDRHDALRSAMLWDGMPRPVQVVYRKAALQVDRIEIDLNRDPMEQLRELLAPEQQRLDLRRAPLLRIKVASSLRDPRRYILLQLHHIACDNQSMQTMLSEVVACLNGRALDLPEPIPYRRHVTQVLHRSANSDYTSYFQSKLSEVLQPTSPFDCLNVHGNGNDLEQVRKRLDSMQGARIRSLLRRLGFSAATLFHSVWALVVSATTGRTDIVFGTVLLGRLSGTSDTRRTIGMFINTLPLRLLLDSITAEELLRRTQSELAELLDYEHVALADAQRCSGILGPAPLFTAVLNYLHNAIDLQTGPTSDEELTLLASPSRTNYPLMLSVNDLDLEFDLVIDADRHINAHRVMRYVCTGILSLLEALESAPLTPALSLSIMPPEESLTVTRKFNATESLYFGEKVVHKLFEEQAALTPKSIAVEHRGRSVSYAQLNDEANRLADYLKEKGVGVDQPVAVYMERSTEMLVAQLGVLKAGGAYMPLDPTYPKDRLRYMLEDAAPQIVLTQSGLIPLPTVAGIEVITLGADYYEGIARLPEGPPVTGEHEVRPENLVYLIYTSGSTGRPKGTAMAHRSMVNLIEWHRHTFPDAEPKRVLQFAATGFDVAFQETFSTLCTGGTLVLLDDWIRRDPNALLGYLSDLAIERLFIPPVLLQTLAECFKTVSEPRLKLQDVITAGEQLRVSPEILSFFGHLRGCRLHNHYGPTETHVVTSLSLAGDPDRWPILPRIGRPISNALVYVLDAQQRPTPLGVTGEIYLGGIGVARGYLARPELTATRFVADPFSTEGGGRLYRTGDIGRWSDDGELEYLGRNDDQVKIRGFRVELGEVEVQLARHELVKEVAVVARDDFGGSKRLVAYVTSRSPSSIDPEALIAHLRRELPPFMVPSAIMVLDRLPLTTNGKLDRRALPMPNFEAHSRQDFEPPQGSTEIELTEMWTEVLQAERVGRNDDYFHLGGHSLTAMKLMVLVAERLGVRIPVQAILSNPTIAQMACVIERLIKDRSAVAGDPVTYDEITL